MKPLSEEELTKCAEEAWLGYDEYDTQCRVLPTSTVFIDAYKQGYIKCVAQMQDEFNELLKACHTALQNQTNVETNKIINQMEGDTTDKERYFVGVDVGDGSDKTGFIKIQNS